MRRTFASLGVRNFRLFFVGQLISNSGNWLTMVALTLLVLHRTDSGSAVGLLTACQFGPMLLFSAWAGLVADRSNKRHLLYITQSLEMAQSFVLAILAFIPHTPLPAFYGVAVAGGVMLAFDNPGRRSFVSEMVDRDRVANAVTLYSAMVNLSRIVGPAIGGVLVVTTGYGWCFTIDGASYVVVIAALVAMRGDELHPVVATPKAKGQVRAGIRYIASVAELRISFIMLLIVGILTYNFQVLFPLYVEKGLHGTDTQYTLIYATFSAGAVIGTMIVARRSHITLRSVVVGAGAMGVAMVGMAAVGNIAVAFPVVALVGGASVAYMTATTALAQLRADRQMVGRVLAIQTVLMIGTTPIGGPILGYLADVAGGRFPVLLAGISALGATAIGVVAGRRRLTRDPVAAVTEDQEEAPAPSG